MKNLESYSMDKEFEEEQTQPAGPEDWEESMEPSASCSSEADGSENESVPLDSDLEEEEKAREELRGKRSLPEEPRERKKRRLGLSEFELQLVKLLVKRVVVICAPAPLDEDELFFKSLLPAMARLTPEKRAEVRLKIHALVHDAIKA